MNRKLFFKLYGLSANNAKIRKIAVTLSKCAEMFFFIIFGTGAALLLIFGRTDLLLRYLAVPLVTFLYNTFIRKVLARPRPFVREENVESFTKHKSSGSCPSNHAASAAVIAMAWYCIYPPSVLFLLVPAFFTGISRIMTGEHYPFDVFLGWTVGITAGFLGFVAKF